MSKNMQRDDFWQKPPVSVVGDLVVAADEAYDFVHIGQRCVDEVFIGPDGISSGTAGKDEQSIDYTRGDG